jgi:RHS repeat-associated protein
MDRMVSWREGPVDPEDNPIVPHADPASLVPSPSGGERWGIDLVGNWDQKWTGMPGSETLNDFEINHLNQYASVTPQGGTVKAFTYDWLGQLRLNQSRSQTYAWDLFGRLTKVYEVGVTDPVAVYRYDALNRRVEKTDGRDLPVDQTTRFIYDDWRAIEERTIEDGTPDREVVRARYGFGRGLDEVVWMDRDIDRDGSIESRLFTHQDGQGSTVLITSDRSSSASALQRIEWFEYTAYGQVTSWNLPWSETEDRYTGTSQGDSRFRLPYVFTGQRLDSESGLMYFKNRYYDPATGRFLQRDPLGYADGPSLYQYARSNPAMYVDRLGLKSWLMSQMEGLVASANIAGRFAQNPELSAMMDSTDERKSDSREEKAEGEASGQGGADAAQEKAETAATEKGTPIVAVKIEPSDEPKKGTYKATYLRADGQLQTAYLNDKFEVNRATFDEDAGKLDDASGEGKMISDFYGGLEQGDVLFRMDEGGRKDVAFVRGTVDKNGNLPIISYGPEPGAKAKKGTLNGADDGYAGYAVVGVWKPPDRASAREYDRRWDAWQRKDKDGYKAGSGFFQCYNLVNALSGKGQTYVKTFFPPTLDDRNLKYWEWLMGLAELDGFPMP